MVTPTHNGEIPAPSFRVILDLDRCEGHGRCVDTAPAVFTFADDAMTAALLCSHVGNDDLPAVERAVLGCPERAITVAEQAR